jgi:MOSC domain-containing protein YiiM/GNAT superfamily N-acetyltransferase
MDGRVLQVNVSPGGVPKRPVDAAHVGLLGLDGDRHDHDWVHGGPHRAVALFGIEAIERVRADGHPAVEPGAVGENITTAGIELARLAVGTRLAIGDEVVLEISSPANPCEVIKGAFRRGKSGRISILLHPDDSRMYARVLDEGTIRPGDAITILPPMHESMAAIHQELDVLESVERDAWLAMWEAAAAAGFDVRILDHGDVTAAASPQLAGSVFNRAFGLRQVPTHRPDVEALFRAAGVAGWLVVGLDDAAGPVDEVESPVGVHVGSTDDVIAATAGLANGSAVAIRELDPNDADEANRWAGIFTAANDIGGPVADAWRRFNPILATARGYHQYVASLAGRDVGVAALFNRRRVGWLGGAAVLPEARGRGIQRLLIADRARRAAAAGSTRLLATADADGPSARNLDAVGLRRIWLRGLLRVDPASAATRMPAAARTPSPSRAPAPAPAPAPEPELA